MSADIETPATRTKKITASTVLSTGLLVGTLDIGIAFIDFYLSTGKNPLQVLLFIASGFFGTTAFAGGAAMMVAGIAFHYCIAFSFVLLFYWLYANTGLALRSWLFTGIWYGLFIWVIMNLIVVPLSAAPHGPVRAMQLPRLLKSMLILICFIGLPLSFIAHRHNSLNQPPN